MYDALIKLTGVNLGGFRGSFFFDFHLYSNAALLIWFSLCIGCRGFLICKICNKLFPKTAAFLNMHINTETKLGYPQLSNASYVFQVIQVLSRFDHTRYEI